MQLLDGRQVEPDRKSKVAGWAPVTEEAKAAGAEPIWDTVARFMKARTIIKPRQVNVPELIGVGANPGIG
jgi:sulfur-oxidizing protein SoxB